MILHCNYEEMKALRFGARTVLDDEQGGKRCAVAAPSRTRARIEALVPRLEGDLLVETLSDQREVQEAVEAIVDCLRSVMEARIVDTHPAHEDAVAAYFDFAHTRVVLARVRQLGGEMEAMIELVTGTPVDDELAADFVFPD